MHLALFGRWTKTLNLEVLHDFQAYLAAEGIAYSVHADYLTQLGEHGIELTGYSRVFETPEELSGVDFLLSLGGDGTMLDAVRFVGPLGLPIVGVNAGRLGFLASVSQYEIKAATADLARGAWRLDPRTMLTVETRPERKFKQCNYGLNEVTLHKANSNEMITIRTFINGEFLNAYWADGLIISTPTGSTAYSLACGGPIIAPTSGVLVLTPIAPHSLTVRPVVIADDAVISFELESRSGQSLVAVDNLTELVDRHTEVAVRKAPFTANLVRLPSRTYFATLRGRLNWGLDLRN
ncbi:MAG: NAD kinase [Bacteroidia bacterium]|nr:NAD kinase [Bacteroidia bacterium]